MKTSLRSAFCFAICISLAGLFTSNAALAADPANYAGKYSLKTHSNKHRGDSLEVVQSQNGLDITTKEKGRQITNHYPLDGTDAPCSTLRGTPAKCKAYFHKNELVLEQTLRLVPSANITKPERRQEHWHLSADGKNLSIDYRLDCLDGTICRSLKEPKAYVRVDAL